mmetsp:Transcript_18494/g.21278  ORF Transcript_18494/g.21278 Transcript_18494/m.21278 type:complete len:271 (+) Transcript_18494:187-999(+)|eukprot:CAMPEP_0194385614 /NCGR_PEP_ID=MMETSP0174-20130528/81269_1 /TAXON_ID=216777 /ORGANISM="Proboscia alata, Strain PI-D3" /LENGTH=270 /DNA_ID=CAMNT_0039173905 /DNA_START=172 /DNA_END=984 /DNA_ORIENTATION=+
MHAKEVSIDTFQEESKRCPITLFVYATMNGYKGPICAEELGIDYNYVIIDFEKGMQRLPEFLAINPKGQIPAMYDADVGMFLAESAAILEYMATKYRSTNPSLFPSPEDNYKRHWAVRQWMLFSATGLAPAMGNAMFFNRIALTKGEVNDFSIKRYTSQSRSMLELLDGQIKQSDGPFLLGNDLTIADINAFAYASTHFWAMVPADDLTALTEWIDLLMNRLSFKEGLKIPFSRPGFFGPSYASQAEIDVEVQRNAAMFTKDGGSNRRKD